MPGAEHLPRGEVQPRGRLSPALLAGPGLFRWRVGQQGTAHEANGQGERPQRPERAPDALHRAKAPQRRPDKDREERAGEPHRPADDTRGQPLAALVPFLGAGLDGGVQKGRAQPRRDTEQYPEPPACGPGQEGRRKEPAAEQGRAPERRAARAVPVLQKAADHTPHPECRDQDAERQPGPLFREAVLLHDRLLEHAPGRGQAC